MREAQDCPNVVTYYGAYLKDSSLLLVMEFCEGGSILDLIVNCDLNLTEDQISGIIWQTLIGLDYLHSKKIIHRDIKVKS